MLNTPGIITDSILYGELESTSQIIDTFDHRLRVIANVFGGHKNGTNNQWKYYPDPSYTIGIIGDSLTTVNESRSCILLNMCDRNEMRIIDVANVADLGRRSFLRDSVLREQVDLGWYVRDKKDIVYSKNKPFIDGKYIIDTSLSLQFVGYRLNDVIDTIHDINLHKEYEFKNYCLYKARKPFAINDNIHFFELEIFTLEGRIARVKAICTDDITAFLKRLFQINMEKRVMVGLIHISLKQSMELVNLCGILEPIAFYLMIIEKMLGNGIILVGVTKRNGTIFMTVFIM